jgi:hypothetical protein
MAPNHHPSPPMPMQLHRGPPGPPPPPPPQAGPYMPQEQLASLNEEVWVRLGKFNQPSLLYTNTMLIVYREFC